VARATLARRPARVRPKFVAAAVLLLATAPLAALGVHYWTPQVTTESFRTDIGQQAEVTLPDGSTVTLDTASRLQVRFTDNERRVVLDGQGWFQLKPSARPFVVSAGDRTITAEAGSFDIRTDPGQVRAFAADGKLALDGASSIALDPGHLLAARGGEVTIRRLGDPLSFTGWRHGMIQFEDIPLTEAVGELNRYRRQPIRIADQRAAALRISGTFRAAETPAFVDALTAGFPVRVQKDHGTGIVIASR
jgi:transmembrane sensor